MHPMKLKAGQRLSSTVCATKVVVVRAPADDVELTCGGAPMVDTADAAAPVGAPAPGHDAGSLLGKRYADEEAGLELLCAQAGAGSLACNGTILPLKAAKPLPASD